VNAPQLEQHQREALKASARVKLAIDHLSDFVRQAWPIVEPGERLIWTWHLDLICDVLERLTRGELFHHADTSDDPEHVAHLGADGVIRRRVTELVICIPPGCMKSLIVSVFWPAWIWLHRPTERLLALSNDDDLVKRDSRRARDVITSTWYAQLLTLKAEADGVPVDQATGERPTWGLKDDQNELINYGTTAQGFRQCKPIGGRVTGKRGHGLILDDPYDAKEAILGSPQQVLNRMLAVRENYYGVLSSRLNDRRTGYRVLIMQRLHQADLAGEMIRRGAYSVVLPMEYDPDHPDLCPDDPRTEPGELLCPARFPREVVDGLKGDLGAQQTAAQLQLRPTAAEGGIFSRGWLAQFYTFDPQRFTQADEWAISVDCTFKGKADNDYVSMGVWARRKRAAFYLLGRVYARLTYTQTRTALRTLHAAWPRVAFVLIEDKANGPAIIDDLAEVIPGLIAFNPDKWGSKDARAQLVARYFEAGNVHLPDPEVAPWVGAYIESLAGFGAGAAHDDDVDMTSQILIYWTKDEGQNALERAKRQASLVGNVTGG